MKAGSQISDTSFEALSVQRECLRRMTPYERLERAFAWSQGVREMALAAIRRRHPEFDESEVRLQFIETVYGRELANEVRHFQQPTQPEIDP